MAYGASALAMIIAACEADGGKTNPSSSAGGSDGGTTSTGGNGGSGGSVSDGGFTPNGGGMPNCESPPNLAVDAILAPEFAQHYTAYDLGPVPGVPDPLGGCVVKHDDPNTLLVAGNSENASGAIYSIGVQREACGHIIGFVGTAQLVANTPYVDANLIYGPGNLMFYTGWPVFLLSQLPDGATSPARETNLTTIGMNSTGDSGPGGLGYVPPPLAAAGEMRTVTWPGGAWYHVALTPDGNLFTPTAVTQTTTLPNNPGGFAYVPAGSAGFANQSLIVAEWVAGNPADDAVATYEVDDQGDPIVSTRKEFFTSFPRPWGAYFEPVTGDYIFLTWGEAPPDRLFIVQGFEPPPPPPT